MSAPDSAFVEPHGTRTISPAGWLMLAVSAGVTAALSLGVHDVMLTRLDIPFPDVGAVPAWARYVDRSVRIASLVWLCRIAAPTLRRLPATRSAMLVGLLMVMLHETVRGLAVGFYLTRGWLDGRWLFTLTDSLSGALVWFFYGVVAAAIARSQRLNTAKRFPAILIVAAIGVLTVQPMLQALAVALEQALSLSEPAEFYVLPYPLHVYTVIYSTFLEPTISAFILAALTWPGLKGSLTRRVLMFVGLLLMIRGRVVTELLFSFWLPLPLGLAFLSEGQFFLETLVLALLTGAVWAAIQQRTHAPEPVR